MKVSELFAKLSRGELSNLSIGNEGSGVINPNYHAKLIDYANDGLMQLYSRFILKESSVIIEQIEHITKYHLISKYTESRGDSEVPFKYIKDLIYDPFNDDVIKILKVYDDQGNERILNDTSNSYSWFTPQPSTLEIPKPVTGKAVAITYQARHIELDSEKPDSIHIEIPFFLESALQSYIAYKVYSHMNGQDNMVKAQEYLQTYDNICVGVEDKDLVNNTFNTSHNKLEVRGFI